MLRSIRLRDFKSFADSGPIELAPFTILFGPNAAGKSNFVDALALIARLASEKTLADAFGPPIRGRTIEAFRCEAGGLADLMKKPRAAFELEATLERNGVATRYLVRVGIEPAQGILGVDDEYLASLTRKGEPKGNAVIERSGEHIHVRRRAKGRPYEIDIGQPFTLLSDRRFAGPGYEVLERTRAEFSSWRSYYLDPRGAMRAVQAPEEATDIGPLGERLAAFLYRLKNTERGRHYDAVRRTVRTIVPSIEDIMVELNAKRGEIELDIQQGGVRYSSRLVSEGTLRVIGLVSLAVNPWGGSLLAFEEPENGIHPRRIELVARLLASMAAGDKRQVIVTTHSPLFCGEVLRMSRDDPDRVRMYNVIREDEATRLVQFRYAGPMFEDEEVRRGLTADSEDGLFERAMLRGLIDGQ